MSRQCWVNWGRVGSSFLDQRRSTTSKNFNRISRANIVTSATRNISKAWSTSKNFNRISRANIVTSATRYISKRWSTSKNFNRISRANIVTSATRNISKVWSTWTNFNRISRANIVTSATRYISKAWVDFKKNSIAFLAPVSWLVALATSPKLGRLWTNFNRISRANIVTSATRNISKAWSTDYYYYYILLHPVARRRLLLRAGAGGGGGGKEAILSMGDGERGVLRENKKERETATLSWNWGFARES